MIEFDTNKIPFKGEIKRRLAQQKQHAIESGEVFPGLEYLYIKIAEDVNKEHPDGNKVTSEMVKYIDCVFNL